jgi:hypothetical protein
MKSALNTSICLIIAAALLCVQGQREEVPLPYGQLHSKPAPPGYVARKCTSKHHQQMLLTIHTLEVLELA